MDILVPAHRLDLCYDIQSKMTLQLITSGEGYKTNAQNYGFAGLYFTGRTTTSGASSIILIIMRCVRLLGMESQKERRNAMTAIS